MLMSATTSADVEQLQKLVLHNPTTLNLLAGPAAAAGGGGDGGDGGGGAAAANGLTDGGSGAAAEISHYHYPCAKGDRALVVLALLKLGLLRKKVLIFANSPDEGMRLRLFLEAFGLRLALLSPDQPLNSRWGGQAAERCVGARRRKASERGPERREGPAPAASSHRPGSVPLSTPRAIRGGARADPGLAPKRVRRAAPAPPPHIPRSHILASFNKGLFDFLIAIGGHGAGPPVKPQSNACQPHPGHFQQYIG
jgi:hypothetical protein